MSNETKTNDFDCIVVGVRLDKQLQPFPNLEKDEVRIQIDGAVCSAFGLPDLAPIRTLLANEPIVTLKPLYSNQ